MRQRNLPQNKSNKRSKRETGDAFPWRYFLMTICCALFLIVGFFFAARQHFSSIDYGIKNSKLRKQIDELESEKRRLILEKEIALSPGEIKKAAKKIGLTTMTASNIEVYRNNPQTIVKTQAEKISALKPTEKSEFEVKATTPSSNKIDDKAANKTDDKTAKPEKAVKTERKPAETKKNTDTKTQNKPIK